MDQETVADKIAHKWGWEFDELMSALEQGGAGDEWHNCSAMQAAHAIILQLSNELTKSGE